MTYSIFLLMVSSLLMLLLARDTSGQEYFPNVTYKDLVDLKSACGDYHNCETQRYYDDFSYNCNCAEFCSQIDTCCVDSKYRDQYPIERKPYNCLRNYGQHPNYYYHMVDRCDPSWSGDSHIQKFCEGNAEELDNMFLAIPVTNSKSGVTYRNHYCAVCHNDTDEEELEFWRLTIGSNSREFNEAEFPEMHFDSTIKVWNYVNETSGERAQIYLTIRPLSEKVYNCFPRMISECAESWNDTEVEAKCKAYMAIMFHFPEESGMKVYRNPHCALCNYENLEEMKCTWEFRHVERDFASNTFFVRVFSLYDKTSKCDDSMVYDTLAKKCRKVYKG